jgi:hypothetical protein
MITALAVGTLSVSVPAWLPLQVSVTLCLILSATLIASAAVSELRSWTLSAMALVAVLILRRGEAWKAVFLQSEQQVLELQQPQQPQTLSRTEYSIPDSLLARDAAGCVLPRASFQSLAKAVGADRRNAQRGNRIEQGQVGLYAGNRDAPVAAGGSGLAIRPALLRSIHVAESDELLPHSRGAQFSRSELGLPEPIGPNTARFYMTYIV